MSSVTFPVEYGGDGKTYTDDADPTTGLDGTGYITRFVPTLAGSVAMAAHATQKADEADQSAQSASASAQQANEDRDSINLDLQALNGLVADAQGSADAAASSATTASNMADAVAEATATYTSVSVGLAATVDGDYFRVINAPDASRVSVYRNDSGSATLITTYYTKTGVDAKQAAAVRLNRSLQRLGDHGQTLHSDFNLAAYGLGTPLYGGVQDAVEGEELWNRFERLSGTYALQHTEDGSLKYVEVPPNTIAREWNPETGQYQAQISGAVTNDILYATDYTQPNWFDSVAGFTPATSVIEGQVAYSAQASGSTFSGFYQGSTAFTSSGKCASLVVERDTASVLDFGIYDATIATFICRARIDFNAETLTVVQGAGELELIKLFSSGPNGGATFRIAASAVGTVGNNNRLWIYPAGTTESSDSTIIHHAQLVEGNVPGPIIVTEDAPVTLAATNISIQL